MQFSCEKKRYKIDTMMEFSSNYYYVNQTIRQKVFLILSLPTGVTQDHIENSKHTGISIHISVFPQSLDDQVFVNYEISLSKGFLSRDRKRIYGID